MKKGLVRGRPVWVAGAVLGYGTLDKVIQPFRGDGFHLLQVVVF